MGEIWGVLAAVLSSAIGGTSIGATRFLVGAIDPLAIGAFRFGIGVLLLLPLALLHRGSWPPRRDWPGVAGLGLLDLYRIQLLRDGAADSALLQQNGAPLMTVVASPEWIGNTIRTNSDIRQDIRWAESGEGNNATLLKAFGINHSYDGFMFLADLFPRRFTCAAGVYTEVPAFVQADATKGMKYDINPAYRTAPYEEAFIFDPMVFTQLIPQPITNPAPNFRFDPVSYVGDIKILNIPNEQCNPDQNILRHRIVMAAASEPKHVWKGVAFVFLRCDPACNNASTCSTS